MRSGRFIRKKPSVFKAFAGVRKLNILLFYPAVLSKVSNSIFEAIGNKAGKHTRRGIEVVITGLTRNPSIIWSFHPQETQCFQGFCGGSKTKYFAVLSCSSIQNFKLYF